MVWVNLSPWRECRLARQRRCGIRALAGVLMLLFIVLLSGKMYQQLNRLRLAQNRAWQQSLEQLAQVAVQRTTRQHLLEREQKVLQQSERRHRQLKRWSRLIGQLDGMLPTSVWLTKMTGDKHRLRFAGHSASMKDIEQFIRSLKRAGWFTQVTMTHLSRTDAGGLHYRLVVDWSEADRDD